MGTNFHTPYTDATAWKPTDANPPFSDLDKVITYLRNVIIHCDGVVTYNALTGVLAWSGILRILFNRTDGKATQNTVTAGNITLSDNEFAYVDLNETNDAVLTVSKAAVTTGSASNFLAYNRVVLGYRNTASDLYFPVHLHAELGVQAITSATDVTVDWSKGKTAIITLAHNVNFTFQGASDGDKLILRVNTGAGGFTPVYPGTVRYSTDIPAIVHTVAAAKQDKIGFDFDGTAAKYDVVAIVKGFA